MHGSVRHTTENEHFIVQKGRHENPDGTVTYNKGKTLSAEESKFLRQLAEEKDGTSMQRLLEKNNNHGYTITDIAITLGFYLNDVKKLHGEKNIDHLKQARPYLDYIEICKTLQINPDDVDTLLSYTQTDVSPSLTALQSTIKEDTKTTEKSTKTNGNVNVTQNAEVTKDAEVKNTQETYSIELDKIDTQRKDKVSFDKATGFYHNDDTTLTSAILYGFLADNPNAIIAVGRDKQCSACNLFKKNYINVSKENTTIPKLLYINVTSDDRNPSKEIDDFIYNHFTGHPIGLPIVFNFTSKQAPAGTGITLTKEKQKDGAVEKEEILAMI